MKLIIALIFQQELEDLQEAVDRAQESLEEKVRNFDQARDYELDIIELEKDNLQERIRQDRFVIFRLCFSPLKYYDKVEIFLTIKSKICLSFTVQYIRTYFLINKFK